MIGWAPSFWMIGIRLVVASARAISSITITWEMLSSWSAKRVGNPTRGGSCFASSSLRSQGNPTGIVSPERGAIVVGELAHDGAQSS